MCQSGAGYEQLREGIYGEQKFQHEKFLYWPGQARSVEISILKISVTEIARVGRGTSNYEKEFPENKSFNTRSSYIDWVKRDQLKFQF